MASKPWEDDLLAKQDSQDRLDYNGFTYVPFARLNGSGSSPNSITTSTISQEYQKQAYFSYEVIGEMTGTSPHTCDITVKVTALDDYSSNSPLKLFAAVVEDTINYYQVYGSHAKNGLDDYSHVLRKLLPTSSGESLGTSVTSGETKEFTYSYTNDETYQNYENIRVIVFVQNLETREILGAFQTPAHPFQVLTNITHTKTTAGTLQNLIFAGLDGQDVSFYLPFDGDVTVFHYSLNGKLLYQKKYNALKAGIQCVGLGNQLQRNSCTIITLSSGSAVVSKRVFAVK